MDKPGNMPGGMLLSLQEGTKLYVYGWRNAYVFESDEVEVKLGVGDMLLFRGDLIHAGADYVTQNIRVHCSFDVKRFRREKNSTATVSVIKKNGAYIDSVGIEWWRWSDPATMTECPQCGHKTDKAPNTPEQNKNTLQRHINVPNTAFVVQNAAPRPEAHRHHS